jgi:tetratricopeptide (TPR) repeat protein
MAEKILINPTISPLVDDLRACGFNLQMQGKVDQAIRMTELALREDPKNVDVLGQLATIHIAKADYEPAAKYLDEALKIDPNNALIKYAFSRYFYNQDHYQSALDWALDALDINPKMVDALIMAAMIYGINGNRHLQKLYHELAVESDPLQSELKVWTSLDQLLCGDFEKGLQNYEYRLATPGANPIPPNGKPIWNGEDLTGKSLVIYLEQGAGDCIQFLRFAKTIKEVFGAQQVIAGCHIPYGLELFRNVQGLDAVFNIHEAKCDNYDYHVAMMSLLKLIPIEHWYKNEQLFKFPASSVKIAKDSFSATSVGICWRGNPKHSNNARRSLKLADMLKVIPDKSVTNHHFSNIQYMPTLDESHSLKDNDIKFTGVEAPECDLMEMALRMLRLGKVVTCDTVIAHMAGSLGIETKLILSPGPDWRWGYEGNKTPWYSSITIYRAKSAMAWDDVTRAIRKELSNVGI